MHGWKYKGVRDVLNSPAPLRCVGGVEVEPQSFLTSALGGEEWSALFSGRLAGGKYADDSLGSRHLPSVPAYTVQDVHSASPNACNKPDTSS